MNLNDQTVEGLRLTDGSAFSVQHHPEAGPGPHDSRHIFGRFADLMDRMGSNSAASKTTSEAN